MIDKLEDLIKTFTGIAEQFTDLESGETFLQILKTRDGQQMVVAVGGRAGTGECPEESEPIINDVEGFGFVSEMMLSARSSLVFFFFGGIGVGLARLVRSGIIFNPNSG